MDEGIEEGGQGTEQMIDVKVEVTKDANREKGKK